MKHRGGRPAHARRRGHAQELIDEIARAVTSERGTALADSLSEEAFNGVSDGKADSSNVVERRLPKDSPWKPVVGGVLAAHLTASRGQFVKAYLLYERAYQAFGEKIWKESDPPSAWSMPVLRALTKRLVSLAIIADRVPRLEQEAQEAEQGAADAAAADARWDAAGEVESTHNKYCRATIALLNTIFGACQQDRQPLSEPDSKRRSMLFVFCMIAKLCFRIDNFTMALTPLNNMKRTMPALDLDRDRSFPATDVVHFSYYYGRIRLMEENYNEAWESLERAFAFCVWLEAEQWRQCILRCLVPLKMRFGRMARPELLERYRLHEYKDLIPAVQSGDLRTFNQCLETHLELYIKHGTYLLVTDCRVLVIRNLFKMVAWTQTRKGLGPVVMPGMTTAEEEKAELDSATAFGKRAQIPLGKFQAAMTWMECPATAEAVESDIINLIYLGHVKGYIAHAKQILVADKENFPKNAFPTSSVVTAPGTGV